MTEDHARAVYRRLQALAHEQYGSNTGALLVVYAAEGFLRRLAASPYASLMTLKGGMLMAATSARRMTKDADLSTVGIANDERRVAEVVADIAAPGPAVGDGLVYDAATIRTESYPPELTLAEKIATMMSRRELNTRDRDFADVWVLTRCLRIPATPLREAIGEVAAHRRHDVVPLSEALARMPDRQVPYSAMLARMAYQLVPPASRRELIADVIAFVSPLIADVSGQLTSWDPEALGWI